MVSLSPLLPKIETLESYRPIYRELAVWHPAMSEICRRHSLDAATLAFAPPGSNVVFWVENDLLIKLFPPFWAGDSVREMRVLKALAGQQDFDIPRVRYAGELEGWPYLVLSRLAGVSLDAVWETLDFSGKLRIAGGLGRMMAALHRVPIIGLSGIGPDWAGFIQCQMENCLEHQRAAGVSAGWLADIADFYATLPSQDEPDFQPVLINADLNPEHIFCRNHGKEWEVSGIIDFGDAMLGHPYYEFVAPGFILAGQPALRRAMLLAYGYSPATLTAALSRQITAQILLHRFIDAAQFSDLFPQRPPQNMRELQEIAWSF